MCGRITQDLPLTMLFDRYRLSSTTPALNLEPRYNGCPTQEFVAVRHDGEELALAKLRWGLVRAWAKDLKLGAKMITEDEARALAWRRWHGREPTTEFDERLRAAFSVTDSGVPVK